jgi:hypothetical protein
LFGWLFVLYSPERTHESIHLASFVYVVGAVMAAPLLVLPRVNRIPVLGLTLATIPLVLLVKHWLGHPIGGPGVPLTLTEIGAVMVTIYLTYRLGSHLEEHRQAAVSTLVSHLHDGAAPLEDGGRAMHRELRRARAQSRPLTVLTIAPADDGLNMALDRVTREVQQATAQRYLQARLADLLAASTKGADILSGSDDHFVMLLSDTGRHRADRVIRTLRAKAQAELGVDLAAGASVFPEDEVTFVKLIERARARMDRGTAADIISRPNAMEAPRPNRSLAHADVEASRPTAASERLQPRRVGVQQSP